MRVTFLPKYKLLYFQANRSALVIHKLVAQTNDTAMREEVRNITVKLIPYQNSKGWLLLRRCSALWKLCFYGHLKLCHIIFIASAIYHTLSSVSVVCWMQILFIINCHQCYEFHVCCLFEAAIFIFEKLYINIYNIT